MQIITVTEVQDFVDSLIKVSTPSMALPMCLCMVFLLTLCQMMLSKLDFLSERIQARRYFLVEGSKGCLARLSDKQKNNDCNIHIWIDWIFFNRVTKMVLHIIFLQFGRKVGNRDSFSKRM